MTEHSWFHLMLIKLWKIITELQSVTLIPSLEVDTKDFPITTLPTSDDLGYRAVLEDAVLDPEMLKNQSLKFSVYTYTRDRCDYRSASFMGPWSGSLYCR